MWSPRQLRDQLRAAGFTVPVLFTVGGIARTKPTHVKWFQPDKLYAEFSQQTDYHVEFWTEDLPSLKKGDTLIDADGQQFEITEPPQFAENKSGGEWSRVQLKSTTRSYPKTPVPRPLVYVSPPPGAPPSPASPQNIADDPPINFGFGDVSHRLIMPLIGAHVVQRITIAVDIAFNGVGAVLNIGTADVPSLLFPAARINLAVAAEYQVGGSIAVAAPDSIYLTLNAGIGASQGAGRIFIERVPQS